MSTKSIPGLSSSEELIKFYFKSSYFYSVFHMKSANIIQSNDDSNTDYDSHRIEITLPNEIIIAAECSVPSNSSIEDREKTRSSMYNRLLFDLIGNGVVFQVEKSIKLNKKMDHVS